MEYQRLFLFTALGGLLLLLWTTWQQDYHRPPEVAQAPSTQQAQPAAQPASPTTPTESTAPGQATISTAGELVRVQTDVLTATISSQGGDIRSVQLRDYSVSSENPAPIALLESDGSRVYIAQSGLE